MKTILAITLVLLVACKDKPAAAPGPAPKPVPEIPAEPPKPVGLPAACTDYIAAIEKLETCEKAAGARETFLRIFESDQDVLTGKRAAPESALTTLCGARAQNVKSVLDSQCGAPLDQRSVTELQTELEKTTFAIAATNAVANDTTQPDALRAKAKDQLPALEKEKLELEALIKQKGDAGKAERTKGITISKECLENPLAKGCS